MRQAELIHEVNLRIRELAGEFAATGAGEDDQEYLCECGCGAWVRLTVVQFDAVGAGGEPVALAGHLAERSRAARANAAGLGDDAAALRAEARHQSAKRQNSPPGA